MSAAKRGRSGVDAEPLDSLDTQRRHEILDAAVQGVRHLRAAHNAAGDC